MRQPRSRDAERSRPSLRAPLRLLGRRAWSGPLGRLDRERHRAWFGALDRLERERHRKRVRVLDRLERGRHRAWNLAAVDERAQRRDLEPQEGGGLRVAEPGLESAAFPRRRFTASGLFRWVQTSGRIPNATSAMVTSIARCAGCRRGRHTRVEDTEPVRHHGGLGWVFAVAKTIVTIALRPRFRST